MRGEKMMFDTMHREISELVRLVRREATWSATIACGKVHLDEVSADALAAHHADVKRIAELTEKYGL
ncbi:hypothetical protein [Burkholderia ubonensis]|uniref:hypothetical protein n=3 Tax=Burkholderiaceae TaxID=119060 RepID=UPI001E4A661E|nr:hypothetical protein [Burkholderia ubonensis]